MRLPDINNITSGAAAWKLDIDPLKMPHVDQTAGLRSWLLHVPGAHPFWSHWLLACCHLRDIEGQSKPARRDYPEAEYEIMIYSIDPDVCPNPDPDRWHEGGFPCLLPFDLRYQFHGVSDGQAIDITDLCASAAMRGDISPDQDYRQVWIKSLDATVEHYRGGHHGG